MKPKSETPKESTKRDVGMQLLWILAILLPLIVLFLLPGGGMMQGGMFFWMGLLLCFWLLSIIFGTTGSSEPEVAARLLSAEEQPLVVKEVMDVRFAEDDGVRVFRGRLREPAAAVYAKLKHALGADSTPLLQADEQFGAAILLAPASVERAVAEPHARSWVNGLLFILTIATTTWEGAAHQSVDLLREPVRFTVGLPYALGLMLILLVHELGHYFMARHHRIRVTLPFFMPVPFALGTFGAFIKMRSPAENRRALFDVAVAGPLAGLVIAIPALLIGLRSSTVVAVTEPAAGMMYAGSRGHPLPLHVIVYLPETIIVDNA